MKPIPTHLDIIYHALSSGDEANILIRLPNYNGLFAVTIRHLVQNLRNISHAGNSKLDYLFDLFSPLDEFKYLDEFAKVDRIDKLDQTVSSLVALFAENQHNNGKNGSRGYRHFLANGKLTIQLPNNQESITQIPMIFHPEQARKLKEMGLFDYEPLKEMSEDEMAFIKILMEIKKFLISFN